MSCKDNKDNNQEYNMKKYLNDSLELDGINVSEDLINKTLDAIKQQDQSPATVATKKIIIWNKYVRHFAGAAAAVLVIFACFGMMRLLPGIGSKKSMSTDQIAYDATAEKESPAKNDSSTVPSTANGLDSTTGNTTDLADNSNTDKNKDAASGAETEQEQEQEDSNHQALQASEKNEYKSSKASDASANGKMSQKKSVSKKNAEDYADASKTKNTSDTETTKAADAMINGDVASAPATTAKKVAPKTAQGSEQNEADKATRFAFNNTNSIALNFTSLCKVNSGETAYIRITDSVNNTSITLTSETQIQEFLASMETYQYTAQELFSDESSFTIDIECPFAVPDQYSISIGNYLTIKYMVDKQVKESIYSITDYEKLKEYLSGLMVEYRK